MNISPITPITKACQLYTNAQNSFPNIFDQVVSDIKYYIVPISRNTHRLRVIIPALSAYAAYQLAKEEFEPDNWTVDPDYRNYKTI